MKHELPDELLTSQSHAIIEFIVSSALQSADKDFIARCEVLGCKHLPKPKSVKQVKNSQANDEELLACLFLLLFIDNRLNFTRSSFKLSGGEQSTGEALQRASIERGLNN